MLMYIHAIKLSTQSSSWYTWVYKRSIIRQWGSTITIWDVVYIMERAWPLASEGHKFKSWPSLLLNLIKLNFWLFKKSFIWLSNWGQYIFLIQILWGLQEILKLKHSIPGIQQALINGSYDCHCLQYAHVLLSQYNATLSFKNNT